MVDMSSIVLSHGSLSYEGNVTVMSGSNEGFFPSPPLPPRFYTTGSPKIVLNPEVRTEPPLAAVEALPESLT